MGAESLPWSRRTHVWRNGNMEILIPKPWPYISQKCKLQKAEWEPEQNIKVIKVIEDGKFTRKVFLLPFLFNSLWTVDMIQQRPPSHHTSSIGSYFVHFCLRLAPLWMKRARSMRVSGAMVRSSAFFCSSATSPGQKVTWWTGRDALNMTWALSRVGCDRLL